MLQPQWILALSDLWDGRAVWSHRLVHPKCGYDDGKYCGAEAGLWDGEWGSRREDHFEEVE